MESVENLSVNMAADTAPTATDGASFPRDVYAATAVGMEELTQAFPYYNEVLTLFQEGKGEVELRKRFMLKMIDEVWVRMIEDTIPSLDVILRNPRRLLNEQEEILPVEQTKRVTSRSVQHLSQHTDLINEIRRDGTVMPSKLLNVFQDETVLTYENRFINTLISRLYAFVSVRFDAAEACGTDEKKTTLTFEQAFTDDEKRGKISLTIEMSEKPREHEVVKNYIYSSDLWKRVLRIRKLVTSYMDSSFVRALGKNYVRPPIMRTNMLLKNVDFRQCLALWEFMETYENTGFESLIEEDVETVDEACLCDFYRSLAAQYVLFQKHIRNAFEKENALDTRGPEAIIHPEIKQELDPFTVREYDHRDLVPDGDPGKITETGLEDDIEQAILIALAADDLLVEEEQDADEEAEMKDGEILFRYRYSFLSRLILAQNPTQDFYTEIKNYLLSFRKVKSRISWNHEAFGAGRKKCARINVKGKTVFLYLPLDPTEFADTKYHIIDVSDTKRTKELPTLLRVRSDRGVRYAKELIDRVMAMFGLERVAEPTFTDYHLPYATRDEMITWNPQLVKIIGVNTVPNDGQSPDTAMPDAENDLQKTETAAPSDAEDLVSDEGPDAEEDPDEADETDETDEIDETDNSAVGLLMDTGFAYRFRYSFLSRLIQAPEAVQSYYGEIKNYLLSYRKVKSSMAWGHESFRFGRGSVARVKIRGKAVLLYMALSPVDYIDSKYHVKDLSDGKDVAPSFPLLFKIRSPRGVKYAKELIDSMMLGLGAVQGEIPTEDYRRPYQTTEELLSLRDPLVRTVKSSRPLSGKAPALINSPNDKNAGTEPPIYVGEGAAKERGAAQEESVRADAED